VVYSVLLDLPGRIGTGAVPGTPVTPASCISNRSFSLGNLLVMDVDMEAAQVLDAGDSYLPTMLFKLYN
jgi:hypothetical protein